MNILVITGRHPPDHSGAGLRIQRTYEDLARRHDVTFNIIAEPMRLEPGTPDLPNVTRLSSAQFAPLLIFKLFLRLKRDKRNITLVHCIGPTRLTVIAALLCQRLKIPYVTEMSLDYDAAKAQRAKPLMAPFFTPNLAIALTPRIATLYRAFGQPDSKIFIRPNPVMMQPNDSVDATPHLPTPYKHLMLGRICPRKNQLRGLELLSKLPPDHGLIIAGPLVEKEDAAYLEKLKSEIARLDLTPRVALHPHAIKNPYALYEKITSLWCLSTHEGLPNVVLEALWMGKPCFVNRDLGLKNYVINNKNGADINLNDLTNAATITKTLSMIDESAIQKDARAAFDPGKINDKTYLLFKKL